MTSGGWKAAYTAPAIASIEAHDASKKFDPPQRRGKTPGKEFAYL
jgi:hypothetical protein